MFQAVIRLIKDLARRRLEEHRRAGTMNQFYTNWVETGCATLKRGVLGICIMSRKHNANTQDTTGGPQRKVKYSVYTDGGCDPPKKDQPPPTAGAGTAEFTYTQTHNHSGEENAGEYEGDDPHDNIGVLTHITAEQVCTMPTLPDTRAADRDHISLGATRHTNNTGELTAMYRALHRAAHRVEGKTGYEDIWTDSLYTLNMTKGKWTPKKGKNGAIIRRLRKIWKTVQKNRGVDTVRIRHVRAHIGKPGNEMADQLAEKGKHAEHVDMRWAREQMRILTEERQRERYRDSNPQAPPPPLSPPPLPPQVSLV
jgi:ribonuclease HI